MSAERVLGRLEGVASGGQHQNRFNAALVDEASEVVELGRAEGIGAGAVDQRQVGALVIADEAPQFVRRLGAVERAFE